jgi:hypothetical protein
MDTNTENSRFTSAIYDLASLTESGQPQTLYAINYNGVLSDNFFVEGQYSKRDLIVGKNSGGKDPSEIYGTLLLDLNSGQRRYWSPTFCGAGAPSCPDKERNNENYLAKASWFLSSPNLGSHDMTLGYDHFEEFNLEENHQSASDYRFTPRAPTCSTRRRRHHETVGFLSICRPATARLFYYQP